MNKTPLNMTLALIVARELTMKTKPHYVSYHDRCEQRIILLTENSNVVYADGSGEPRPLQVSHDWANESVRIVRKDSKWGPKLVMKGWEVYAEADRREQAGKSLRAMIYDNECQYDGNVFRRTFDDSEYCGLTARGYAIQWPAEDWEDVTEEALMAYANMVGGK